MSPSSLTNAAFWVSDRASQHPVILSAIRVGSVSRLCPACPVFGSHPFTQPPPKRQKGLHPNNRRRGRCQKLR
jgi:hypothetical protein